MASSSSALLLQEILQPFRSRKLLLYPTFIRQSSPAAAAAAPPSGGNDLLEPSSNIFSANTVMVLSVLLFAMICSLVLNYIIRCALMRCSRYVSSHNNSLRGNDSSTAAAKLANTGVTKKALKTFPVVNYAAHLKLSGLDSECAICLSDFSPAERVRVLPKCNHGFHVKCIDKWLNSHSSCPTCRNCLLETCHKIASTAAPGISTPPPPPPRDPSQETIVRIEPLQPEGFVRSCHQ